MKKHLWKIIIAVIIIALGGAYLYAERAAEQANEGVTIETHVKGNPDAEVVLVEYSDFQCPACAQFYPYIKNILDEHGENIRFEYRHFPLINIHPHAVPAARAAEAAGQQGKFFEMHDKLFENQPEWSKSAAPTVFFERYANELGLDMALFKRHMNASIITEAINDSFDDARERGFTGTPSFLLNGEPMEFATFDEFEQMIVEAAGGAPEEGTQE